jgi:hypothetical protein
MILMKTILALPVNFIRAIFTAIGSFFTFISNQIAAFFNALKQPTQNSALSMKGLIISLIIGLVVAIVAIMAQPFGLSEFQHADKTLLLAAFGVVAFFGMLICQFVLPLALGGVYNEYKWTIGKQVVHALITVLVVTLLMIVYAHQFDIAKFDIALDTLKVLVISLLPILIITIIQGNSMSNSFASKATDINSNLNKLTVTKANQALPVMIFGEGSAKLSLLPNQLICAEISKDNTTFYYQNLFGVEKKSVSVNVASVEKELAEHSQFIKLNNNYIVNAHAIHDVNGSGRGYDLKIARVEKEISVAKKFNAILEKI